MDQLHARGDATLVTRCERDERHSIISADGLELVDVREGGRGLNPASSLKFQSQDSLPILGPDCRTESQSSAGQSSGIGYCLSQRGGGRRRLSAQLSVISLENLRGQNEE